MPKPKVIILVDDEFIILESLKIQLSRIISSDHKLELASSGEEAIGLINELHDEGEDLALVISDFNIDSYKGTDVLKHALGLYPLVKKIILTGQADTKAINEFEEKYGIDAILEKPWDLASIKFIVDSIDHSRLHN
ncbi:MAG: response regulator [Bacteroidota bacterium]|jgi:response regulator RpfG family c-di-GMP phosphodiesterase